LLPKSSALFPYFLASILLILLVACAGNGKPAVFSADPVVTEGQRIFKQNCSTCHSTNPGAIIVGPSLAGIATRAHTRVEGWDGREYIQTSIIKPSAYVVDGFTDLMPSNFGKSLSGEELEALIAYLLTLE
jgi:nitric oxide reductase subunit C